MTADDDGPGSLAARDRKLAWLYGDPKRCLCRHSYERMGRFNGIDMGRDWVRMTTNPECPEHGRAVASGIPPQKAGK